MEYFWLLDWHLPEGVGIAAYGIEHIAWLAAGAGVCVLLCLCARRLGAAGRRRLGLCVSGFTLCLELFRIALQIGSGVFSAQYLPLHLCGIAVFISFYHALRGGALTGEVLYGVCMPSAVCALLFPDWIRYPALNIQSIQAFIAHILLTAYPLLCVAGGGIRPRARRLPQCLIVLGTLALPLYILNKLLGTNFFFLNWPSPGSPLELFEPFLGNPGYILGYIPLLAAIWLILYGPLELARSVKRRRERSVPDVYL